MASYEISALSELDSDPRSYILQKFRLYETRSRFYMIGRNKHQTLWSVLKIDRLEPTELNIHEDCTTYSEVECCDLLNRIHEGNISTGGLKFVTVCYGIVGFIKFLGPYYMLLITKRRQIGAIGGHAIYAITKTAMIPIPNSTLLSNMALSKSEDRYKKLLGTLDLTKDFFFSYSYHVMRSLQKNLCDGETGQVLYNSMFVWNEFLTRRIRNDLKNTLWTVALVYGFFKQAKLEISGRYFNLTLIARRSRYYAGTRYLKRGVNEKGRVANDVETEQIVFEDTPEGCPAHMSSVVQHRGSIPLFWSQEVSGLNIKPDIIVSKKDQNYQATRTHFDDLVKRYGNPIIIFNLIKTRERKPRESKLGTEFAKAIETINKDLSGESRLKFLHWDLNKHARSKDTNVLALLDHVARDALDLTGFFHSQVLPELRFGVSSEWLNSLIDVINTTHDEDDVVYSSAHDNDVVNLSEHDDIDNNKKFELRLGEGKVDANGKHFAIPLMLQKGVLRTNCIDCLDRTNVAQYAYGLAALGRQLHALGFIDIPKIDPDSPLTDVLMRFYEAMGNTLALQYGGSAAHNWIFSDRRGHWRVATRPQEFFRGLQRFYSNTYMDAEKQDAINIFLGYFQPQQNEHALWEMDSDQHYDVGRHDLTFGDENSRPSIKRSASYDNIVCERDTPVSSTNVDQKISYTSGLLEKTVGDNNRLLSDSTSDCDSDISYGRYTPLMARGQRLTEMRNDQIRFGQDAYNCSNFVDVERLSSRSSSYEDLYEKSTLLNSMSSESVVNGITDLTFETTSASNEHGSSIKGSNVVGEFSNNFVHWVSALCQSSIAGNLGLNSNTKVRQTQRQVGETALNDTSSRSHQIIRLNLVDLAGSERTSQTNVDG